jgi:plastocyanin
VMKKMIAALAVFGLIAMLIAACGGSGGSSSASSSGGSGGGSAGPTVHMNASNFEQSSVTVPKGDSLTLVDDASVVHIINNGSWVNGSPKPAKEPGAPTVNQQFQGNDTHTVGPFNTAGTYHLYCTVHQNMNLTVTVQ